MKPTLALLALALAATAGAADRATAQAGRDSRDDGADARTDASLGTPNRVTPVPQTNQFSTSPRLEQQAPGPIGKPPAKDPGTPRSPQRVSP
jgi:hypothetical protein